MEVCARSLVARRSFLLRASSVAPRLRVHLWPPYSPCAGATLLTSAEREQRTIADLFEARVGGVRGDAVRDFA